MHFQGHSRLGVALKEENSNDIAFFLEVNFDQHKCAVNTFECGRWHKELDNYHCPFKYNEEFELKLVCDNTEIVIFNKDQQLGSFCHCLPPYKINRLEIRTMKIHAVTLLPGSCE
uniref:32 kDa beta-galactoside-binding lectin-like n=1 Tax=Myxine glutinosa TaxID=7769 RepID=UPI00358F8DC7